jgi:uncharacterized protein
MTVPSAEAIITSLRLEPHPKEGGFFREVYRSEEQLPAAALPDRYAAPRSFGTCIYYLLTPQTFSAMHRLASDEIFHFYLGDPVQMLQLFANGQGKLITIGPDILNGQSPQVIVPRGVWQGSCLMPGGSAGFALLGTTVAPGFDYADYEHGHRDELVAAYPAFSEMIHRLTTTAGR